jgi:hypothetical protein
MAYVATNPPKLLTGFAGKGQIFQYQSADAIGTVDDAGYFTNGKDLGMKLHDLVIVVDATTPKTSLARVSNVNATTGAVTVAPVVTEA